MCVCECFLCVRCLCDCLGRVFYCCRRVCVTAAETVRAEEEDPFLDEVEEDAATPESDQVTGPGGPV